MKLEETQLAGKLGPCSGLRVIEFASMVSGPFAGQFLADLGAEVIKIEAITGDPLRGLMPAHKGMAAYFSLFNRNKKSIAIDLKADDGVALARELALSGDVVIENFRPGVMDRLGLGYSGLKEANPGLVYLAISGFGPDGPYANRPAYDHVIQGISGIMPDLGSKSDPLPMRSMIVDKTAAILACNAALAALLYRERHGGIGQKIDVSLLDAFSSFALPELLNNYVFQAQGVEPIRRINLHHPVPTSDGHVIGHIQTNAQFAGLCKLFGREELVNDPRFSQPWPRLSNYEDMWAEICKTSRDFATQEILEGAERYNVPLGIVNDVEMFFDDPQVQYNHCYFDVEDPDLGTMRNPGFFADFSESPASYRYRAPQRGEHTNEIMQELGKTEAEITAARNAKIIS